MSEKIDKFYAELVNKLYIIHDDINMGRGLTLELKAARFAEIRKFFDYSINELLNEKVDAALAIVQKYKNLGTDADDKLFMFVMEIINDDLLKLLKFSEFPK